MTDNFTPRSGFGMERFAWHAVNFYVAILLGISIGIATLAFAPMVFSCERLGWSTFEGACGFGFLYFFAIPSGLLSAIISFVLLGLHANRTAETGREKTGPIPNWLFLIWGASLVLYIGGIRVNAIVFIHLFLSLFVWTSAKIATLRGRSSSIALLVLIPYLGCLVVAWVLFGTDIKALWTRLRSD